MLLLNKTFMIVAIILTPQNLILPENPPPLKYIKNNREYSLPWALEISKDGLKTISYNYTCRKCSKVASISSDRLSSSLILN